MKTWRTLRIFLFLMTALSTCAEPDNILVDKYVFTRPKRWQWKAPGNASPALNRFLVPGSSDSMKTDVRFYLLSGNSPDFRNRLLVNFDGNPETSERTVAVNDTKIIYFTGVGTVIDPNRKKVPPKPDYQYTCTLLPTDVSDKHLYIRIAGPRAEVESALDEFTGMVERALKESRRP